MVLTMTGSQMCLGNAGSLDLKRVLPLPGLLFQGGSLPCTVMVT